jgi:hypothetical protein
MLALADSFQNPFSLFSSNSCRHSVVFLYGDFHSIFSFLPTLHYSNAGTGLIIARQDICRILLFKNAEGELIPNYDFHAIPFHAVSQEILSNIRANHRHTEFDDEISS